MNEYISREDARAFAITVSTSFGRIDAVPLDDIDELQASDVQPVVFCRNCAVPHNKWTGCPKLGGLVTEPDFFCAFGEPKGDSE